MLDIINTIWTVVEPLWALIVLGFVCASWLRLKKAQRKLTVKAQEGETQLILNFTGHPLALFQDDWGKGIEQVHVPCTLPVNDGQVAVEKYIRELITGLKPEIYGRVLAGDCQVYIATPNLCVPEFLGTWHGIAGQFPVCLRSQRADGKFVWLKPRDIQALRLETRAQVRGS